METKTIYLTIRIDFEHNENILDAEDFILSELDYNFSIDSNDITITDTEICGADGLI
jgi:hypothetical protein